METLLHWRTLVFVVPVVFGAVLALGAALGVLQDGHDAGHDGSHHGHEEALAFGRLPLALRLMLLAFTFGGVGLVVGPGVWAFVPGETLGGVAAIAVAITGAAASTRALSQLVQAPLLGSETIRRPELVGRVGRVVVSASTTSGAAQVRDARGNLHQVACHIDQFDSPVPAGTDVLLVDYHEQRRSFVVSASPFSARAATG